MSEPVYGLVENNRITLFPLTVQDINERDNPAETYIEGFYNEAFDVSQLKIYEKIVETPIFLGPVIYIERKIVTRTVEELFEWIASFAIKFTEEGVPYVDPYQITPEIFDAFEFVIKIRVQEELDKFAQAKGYDNFIFLSSYRGSTVERFRSDADYGDQIREDSWESLFIYFNQIKAGQAPIPLSWSEIATHLPAMTWDNLP